ncbi:MAG: transferrin receptor-like dimerization domain-containing protein [Bryobacteraceae bacterium]
MKFSYLLTPALAAASFAAAQTQTVRGFLPSDLQQESDAEAKARAIPEGARMAKYMEYIAGQPHQAGSPRSKAVAEYIAGLLKEWGLDVQIESFDVLLPYPTVRKVEVLAPKKYEAKLKEPVVPEDPNSGDKNQLPTYNAYSASGDVTGDVVYANYGLPDDYDYLAKHGIDVKGKIVITRYGKSWRGIKPKLAAAHGAIACLIYSDPHEDGFFEGDIFPTGPMRPWQGVQRGSVMDMPLYSGDPLTPGWAAVPGAKRLSRDEAQVLMKIPVLPISYGDAQPILDQLTGPLAPESWRGTLPFTYHLGPGATKVHIKTDFDWTLKPIFDVIATIPGSVSANEWVMAGNHHDAWVNGADDPVSGTVSLLETARALATMSKQGWRPKRTVKIAFWDSEEFGLIGSTEWVEKHQDELRQQGVAYLNSDSNGRGWLHVSGSHTLEAFVAEVAQSVTQPGVNESLAQAKLTHKPPENAPPEEEPEKKQKTFTIGALGAGSDYVAFLDFAGVASMNEGFGGMDRSGIYHSVYDSIYWYNHFSDATHIYGQALSEYTATALMRLADADILPFEFGHFAQTVTGYLSEIEKEAAGKGQPLVFPDVRKQLQVLVENSAKYDSALKTAVSKNTLDASAVAGLNTTLMRTERALTRPEGLPNRSWYKHQIYAPGFYTGYGVKTLPGIREAVDAKQWQLATEEAGKVADCLRQMNALVEKATEEAQGL